MSNLDTAKSQSRLIGAAINGDSSSLQVLGNVGQDPHPEVLLAVALAHTQNALAAVIAELEELRSQVEASGRSGGIFRR